MSSIEKPDWETKDSDEQNREAEGVFENPTLGDFNTSRIDKAIKQLYEKIREGIDAINTNTSKTGITTAQANAITANTAKTGITTSQANAITANTAKTGITTTQATTITANKNLCAALDIMRFQNVPQVGLNSKNKMDISCTWAINKTTSKLELTMTASPAGGVSGTRYSSVIATLDPIKKGK